ncbi:MAG: hypothetical protein J6P90_05415 [Rikenellaceae bacterium]|nr:hypothetical protein [Rikenellaceae bacterium]
MVPYSFLKRIIAKVIIPQGRYSTSKDLFLRNARKVSFDSFLSWIRLGEGLNARIAHLFNEYLTIPTLVRMMVCSCPRWSRLYAAVARMRRW